MGNELGCTQNDRDESLNEDEKLENHKFREPEVAILKETFKKVGDKQGSESLNR